MELRHFRYFLAVAEHQGFRKAALFLRVSHSSICAQIIDLETEIATRLFEVTNQRVSLTAAGHTFISGARRTLESALQAVETAQQASLDYRGELRIASVGLMCPALLAQLIGTFRKRFPKVEVSIQQQNNFKSVQGTQKRADIGIGFATTESTGGPTGCSKVGPSPSHRSPLQWQRRPSNHPEAPPNFKISRTCPFSCSIRDTRRAIWNGPVRFSSKRDSNRSRRY